MHARSLAWSTNPAAASAGIATVLPQQANLERRDAVVPAAGGRPKSPQPQPPGSPPPTPAVHPRPPQQQQQPDDGNATATRTVHLRPFLHAAPLRECSRLDNPCANAPIPRTAEQPKFS